MKAPRSAPVLALLLALAACRTPPVPRKAPGAIAAVRAYEATPPLPEREALAAAGFPDGAVAWLVLDPRSTEVMSARAPEAALPPGSVAKVATCVAVLQLLGPEHRFATALVATGPVLDGVLQGDLVLRGGGDPLLTTPDLAAMAHRLREVGVRKVGGRFLLDESLYAPAERIHPQQDDDAAYDPGAGALALDLNQVRVRWRPAEAGAVQAWAVPPGDFAFGLALPGALTKFTRGAPAGAVALEPWSLAPELPPRGEQRLPVYRPGEHAAQVFAALAREMGVEVPALGGTVAATAGAVDERSGARDPRPASSGARSSSAPADPAAEGGPSRGPAQDRARILVEHRGRTLVEIARVALEQSENPVAEMLALAVARARTGRPPTMGEAGIELNRYWSERGVELALENGSGLSGKSRVSPKAAAAVLLAARTLPGPPFFTLLPAAGLTGTLARRLATPEVALRAWAKTGTIAYGAALAGHLFTRGGRELVFALFIGEPVLREAAKARPPANREEANQVEQDEQAWIDRARALQEALVAGWIARL